MSGPIVKEEILIKGNNKDLSRDFLRFYKRLNKCNSDYLSEIIYIRIKKRLILVNKLLDKIYEENNILVEYGFENGDLNKIYEEIKKSIILLDSIYEGVNYSNYEEFIINLKLKILPNIELHLEKYERTYDYYKTLKREFEDVSNNTMELCKREVKEFLEKSQEEAKELINKEYKEILKYIKSCDKKDINLMALNKIKEDVFNIEKLNLEVFNLYTKFKEIIINNFKDLSLLKKEHENNNFEFKSELLNLNNLNKRYLKIIEEYSSFGLKEKIIKDLNELLGADTFKEKLFVEYIYTNDFVSSEYEKDFKTFVCELKEKFHAEVYIKFMEYYGDMNNFREEKSLLLKIYDEINCMSFNEMSKVSLVDMLNHSKSK